MRTNICILLFTGFINNSLIGQDNWDFIYKTTTIDSLIDNVGKGLTNVDFNYNGLYSDKYKINVIYEDSIKPLDQNDKLFIDSWVKSFQIDPYYKDLFQNKILCTYKGNRYWIFSQKQLISYYKSELVKKDKISLYIMFLGSINKDNKKQFIFIANEFRKLE